MNRVGEFVSNIRNNNNFSLEKREYLCMYILYTHTTHGVCVGVCVCGCCDSGVNMWLCGR